jgi:hypothetical protein
VLKKSSKANDNYLAKVVKLGTPVKHPNADKLQGFVIDGNRVWGGMTYQEGDVAVYFPLECAINSKLLSGLNLYSDANLNVDQSIKGYFTDKGRVKAVRLRGEASEGFLLPYGEVANIMGQSVGNPGDEFDTWNDELLVWKYVPKRDLSQKVSHESAKKAQRIKRFSKLIPEHFKLHEDTAQLKKNLHKITPDTPISVSYKLHGTSFVVGNVLTKKKLNWKERVAKWFGIDIQQTVHDLIYSSRNVVKNQYINTEVTGGYYKEDLWADIKDYLSPYLLKGMTVYGECVGYTRGGKSIQKDYDYGCVPPSGDPYTEGKHFKVYIYRITMTNADGKVIELTQQQILDFVVKNGLRMVPTIFMGEAGNLIDSKKDELISSVEWEEKLLDKLMTDKKLGYQDVMCYICKNKVPAEGVVVRIENLYNWEAYKLKSFKFLEKESKDLDTGEVDMETAEATTEVQ